MFDGEVWYAVHAVANLTRLKSEVHKYMLSAWLSMYAALSIFQDALQKLHTEEYRYMTSHESPTFLRA